MLIFLLKGQKPNKYGDKVQQKHVGPDGGAITFTLTLDRPDDEL